MRSFTKSLFANKVVKNFSFLTISNFFNQFTLVFASIKIARTLGPVDFGGYTYIYIQAILFAVIAELGLRAIVIRTIARNPERAKSIFLSAVSLQLLGLVFSASLLIIYQYYNPAIESSLIILVIANIFLINFWGNCESIWQGVQRMSIPAIINVLYSIVWVAFILISPLNNFTIVYLYKNYILIQVLQTVTLFAFLLLTKGILSGPISFISDVKTILSESVYYYFNALIALPTNALSNNFLEMNSSKPQLGYFNTSNRLISPVKTVTSLGFTAIFPNLSVLWINDRVNFYKKLQAGFPLLIVFFGCICFGFVMISKELVLILFGEAFLPSYAIIKYQIWFLFMFSLHSFIGTIWSSTNNHKILTIWSIINTVIATPLLFFGSKYGGLGLSYAYIIAYFITFPFIFYYFKKSIDLKIDVTKEALLVLTLFIISCILPNDAPFYIRMIILSLMFAGIFLSYRKILTRRINGLKITE
jgi:O-antigen/teichoic acid export membrane protein